MVGNPGGTSNHIHNFDTDVSSYNSMTHTDIIEEQNKRIEELEKLVDRLITQLTPEMLT